MKYLYTLLCASLALTVFAREPQLSPSDLQQTSVIADLLLDTSSMSGAVTVQSPHPFMQGSNLTLNDNRLTVKSPRSWSVEELEGAKIAVADAYNFEWNDSAGKPKIIETDYAMMGIGCRLTCSGNQGNMKLSGMYGDFTFPMHIDLTSGVVTIEAGKAIATLSNAAYPNSNPSVIRTGVYPTQNWILKEWTLYAMPLSRLMGIDNSDTIHGQVNEDGTISFNDDFAFLVSQEIVGEDACTWGLSPIFKNLTLLNPNGTHKFQYTRTIFKEDPIPTDLGNGGLVPRNTKPGSSKPVPSFAPFNLRGTNIDDNQKMKTGGGRAMDTGTVIHPETVTTTEVRPVHIMYQSDDSTLIVYNLFGLGNRCYMKINSDGTIELPHQQAYNDGLGHIYYSNSCNATHSQDSIMWGSVSLLSDFLLKRQFDFNLLLLTGASIDFNVPQEPVLFYEEDDTSVVFYAAADESDGAEAILYLYDEEAGEYFEVENPLYIQRENEPFWIHLAAVAYDPNTFVPSDWVYLEYEIPALGGSVISLRGDVNGDTSVNISDVTALIDYLLTGNQAHISIDNADCNTDGNVNISDVTALIDFLLNGTWAE